MRIDSQGREIIAAPWDAINGIPAIISEFGALTDPGVDAVPMWDDSAGDFVWVEPYDLIDLAADYVWSGEHTFTKSYAGLGTEAILLSSASPLITWSATGGAADAKRWSAFASATTWQLRAFNDAASSGADVLTFARVGAALTEMTYGNNTDLPDHAFYGDVTFNSNAFFTGQYSLGVGTSGISIGEDSDYTAINFVSAAAASNAKLWQNYTGPTGEWVIATLNDAASVSRAALTLLRTGVAVSSLTYGNSTDNPLHTFHGGITGLRSYISNTEAGAVLSSSSPTLVLDQTSAAANGRYWAIGSYFTSARMSISAINDGITVLGIAWDATRSGAAITSIQYGNSTDSPAHAFYGAVQFAGYGAGTLVTDASGNITAVSDEGVKRQIRPFDRGLAAILALEPILHGYKNESGLDQSHNNYAGFSAQNVERFIPEAVGRNPVGQRTFSDRPVLAAMVNAVKELAARIEALEQV